MNTAHALCFKRVDTVLECSNLLEQHTRILFVQPRVGLHKALLGW